MRAARLMQILFEIESRPGITAEQLAHGLGVSIRTIYRDVASLQVSGVPVYGTSGRGGGLHLVQGYRSRSAALRADEAAALLMGVVPIVAEQLGLGEPLARAERKVFAQLGATFGSDVDVERAQILIDPIGWYRSPDEAPHLAVIAGALRTRRVVSIRYRRWEEPTLVRRRIEPHGLVLKAGVWYVVARSSSRSRPASMRTYRVNQIIVATLTDTAFEPLDSFDLAAAWDTFLASFRQRLDVYRAEVRLTAAGRERLRTEGDPAVLSALAEATETVDGSVLATLRFESIETATSMMLRLGLDAEPIAPLELVERVAATAAAIAGRIASG